jgi:tetratricopeptide (TPR) repeat protein
LLHKPLKRYREAEEVYRSAVAIEPTDADVWYRLGRLLHHSLRRLSDAKAAYERSIGCATTQTISDVRSELGILHLDMDDPQEASRCFAGALEEWLSETAKGKTRPTSADSLIVIASLAAAGYLPLVLRRLSESDMAATAEPLLVAIKLLLGEKPRVAAEILETAKDVARDISTASLRF